MSNKLPNLVTLSRSILKAIHSLLLNQHFYELVTMVFRYELNGEFSTSPKHSGFESLYNYWKRGCN